MFKFLSGVLCRHFRRAGGGGGVDIKSNGPKALLDLVFILLGC